MIALRKKWATLVLGSALTLGQAAWSQEDSIAGKPMVNTSIYAILQGGQIVNGKYRGKELEDPAWLNNALINLAFSAKVRERLEIFASLEAATWYNTYPTRQIANRFDVPAQAQDFYIHRAEGIYSFGGGNSAPTRLAIGLTPYKYNHDARNLGEYLFRTGTYPAYILAEFEYAFARITGARLVRNLFGVWENEILITQETAVSPLLDINLTYVTSLRPFPGLELGGGVQFARLVPADPEETTPKSSGNIYFKDSLAVDSLGNPLDTSYYTLKGVKFMGRFALDLKAYLPGDFWGAADMRLYAEAAVLGWKNYPVHYEKRLERIPVMIGFTLPTFRVLDVLSLEAEWFGAKYPNNFENVVIEGNQGSNTPTQGAVDYADYDYGKDDWKWSVYAGKTLAPGFQIIAQASRDHMRHKSEFAFQADREEALTAKDHWYWMVRVIFGI